MNWVKENLPVVILVVGLFVGYAELRLPGMVETEMNKRGLAKSGDIAALQDKIEEQKVVHKEDRDRIDSKVERIVDILLED